MVVNYNSCHDIGQAIDIESTGLGINDKEKKAEQQKCQASLREYIDTRCTLPKGVTIIEETRDDENWLHIQTADCPFSGPGN